MIKKKILLLNLILIGLNSWAQDLNCSDFKNGTFIMRNESGKLIDYKLVRKDNFQIEFSGSAGEEMTNYGNIEWINDCSYRLKFDGTKMKLTEDLMFINENGGIVTEMTKIKGKCFYYKSVLIVNGKEVKRIDGSFCKE